MKTYKVGVIGAGYWGPNLIRNFSNLPQAEVRVVCDLKQERLDHIKSRFPEIHTTRNYKELLDADVDAVVIATPVSTHYRLATACLSAGKHILVEKPLACNSLEGEEIVSLAHQKGLTCMTGHTFLYNPAVVAVKQIIDSGEIGDVYYINGTRVNLGLYQPDINVVWDLAPHDVSILLYLLGVKPIQASARGGMFVKPGVHDVAYLTLYFPHNVMADLRVSWLDPCKIRRITIVGSKKMLVYDDIEKDDKVMVYDKGVDVQPYTDTFEEFHMAYRYGDPVPYKFQWDEPLKLECQHFIDCIDQGCAPLSDAEQGLHVIRVLEAAQKSLLNGGMREEVEWETQTLLTA